MASRSCQIFLASTTKAQEAPTVSTYCTALPGFSPAVSPNQTRKFCNLRKSVFWLLLSDQASLAEQEERNPRSGFLYDVILALG